MPHWTGGFDGKVEGVAHDSYGDVELGTSLLACELNHTEGWPNVFSDRRNTGGRMEV